MNPETLHAYFDGELTDEEAVVVERTLAADPTLAAQFARLRDVDDALGLLDAGACGDDFVGRVVERSRIDDALDALPAHPGADGFTERVVGAAARTRRRGLLVRLAVPLAAAAAMILAVWITPTENPLPPPPAEAVDYAWEDDMETFGSLAMTGLEDAILKELEAT